ncbi:MAG TPA: NAD(P)H-dependent oxidoreductase [Bacillales bacterium]|nr:NAD(P)H-dependent oxidoreductase [Bacillales bacterium]
MKHCIIFAHPKLNSFNGAILHNYRQALEEYGHDVEVRDVYRLNWDPVLTWEEYQAQFNGKYATDVLVEQAFIREAEAVTFIYPVWWAGLPARAKGYLDRVFAYGFAYELDGEDPIPLLKGKKAATIFTSGTPEEIYRTSGMSESLKKTMEEGVFDFCGFETIGHLYFGNAVLSSDQERERMLFEVSKFAGGFKEES